MKKTVPAQGKQTVSPDRKMLLLLAFIEGSSVMAIELLSGKMFAPYYGNALYIWTTVIGITLSGMAAGYYAGGYLTTKFSGKSLIHYVFLLSAVLVVLLPAWANRLMLWCVDMGFQKGAVVSCLGFLFPVMFAHGMIPPILIKSAGENRDRSGSITGKIYAVSTTGGIVATLLTGFIIIPSFGLRLPAYMNAILLGIIPIIFFLRNKILIAVAGILLFFISIPSGLRTPARKPSSMIKIQHRSDGLLGQIVAVDDLPNQKRTLMVNNISQSFIHIPSQRSQWRYIHRLAMYCSLKPENSHVLVCGLGGGNLVSELSRLKFRIDAVEIDPRMQKVATDLFFMPPTARVFTDDARHYLRTCKEQYDIIILDMSAGENQPSNVYTGACFKEIQSLLKPDGWLFVHYQNKLKGGGSKAIRSIGATLVSSGFITKMINTKPDSNMTSEFVFHAVLKDVDLSKFSYERRDPFADPFYFPRNKDVYLENFSFDRGIILTDDKPIMDVLHTPALEGTRGATVKQLFPIFIKEGIDIF